jgi:dihydroxyacid dehydratase/phosphogluconate dehydratase
MDSSNVAGSGGMGIKTYVLSSDVVSPEKLQTGGPVKIVVAGTIVSIDETKKTITVAVNSEIEAKSLAQRLVTLASKHPIACTITLCSVTGSLIILAATGNLQAAIAAVGTILSRV